MLRAPTCEASLKRVTVMMPPDMHKRLKLESIERDITMNDLIIIAVEKYLRGCSNPEYENRLD